MAGVEPASNAALGGYLCLQIEGICAQLEQICAQDQAQLERVQQARQQLLAVTTAATSASIDAGAPSNGAGHLASVAQRKSGALAKLEGLQSEQQFANSPLPQLRQKSQLTAPVVLWYLPNTHVLQTDFCS